jgi:hypothetical protein
MTQRLVTSHDTDLTCSVLFAQSIGTRVWIPLVVEASLRVEVPHLCRLFVFVYVHSLQLLNTMSRSTAATYHRTTPQHVELTFIATHPRRGGN